jgi:SAM-dependent methyltransferase
MSEQRVNPLEEVRRGRLLIARCDTWLFEEIRPHLGRRVLEVGCGHGNLTQHLLDRDLVVAIDVEPSSVEIVRAKFRGCHNVLAYTHDICDEAVQALAAHAIDTVVSLNVLEHIEDDTLALVNMGRILLPGGTLVLIVPAFGWLYGTMDAAIGHFRRYTKMSIVAKLKQAGFAVSPLYYMNALGALGWFVNGRVLRQEVPPSGQLRWFNRLVPLVATVERLLRPPLGISLVSIASHGGQKE